MFPPAREVRLGQKARAQKIDLDSRKSWCVSRDPEFVAKSAEIHQKQLGTLVSHP